jgi:hypothetical protein
VVLFWKQTEVQVRLKTTSPRTSACPARHCCNESLRRDRIQQFARKPTLPKRTHPLYGEMHQLVARPASVMKC